MGVDDLGDVGLGGFGACGFGHEHSPSAISLDHLGARVISVTPDQVRARDGTATLLVEGGRLTVAGWRWSSGPCPASALRDCFECERDALAAADTQGDDAALQTVTAHR